MPIYQYKCRDCGKEFTRFQLFGPPRPVVDCTHCGGHNAAPVKPDERAAEPKCTEHG